MDALVYSSPWNVGISQRLIPTITKGNQVLVEVKATGICGTDIGIISGAYHAVSGVVLGHESAGVVVKTGSEVDDLRVGDRVVIDPTFYCGKCNYCRTERQNHCEKKTSTETGVSSDGTFTQFYLTEDRFLYKLNDHVSFEEASFTEPLSCTLTGLRQLSLRSDARTIVWGGGPMGMLYCYAMAAYGLQGVVVEISAGRRQLLASRLPDGWEVCESATQALESINGTSSGLVDLIVDTSGAMTGPSLEIMARGAQLLLVGLRAGNVSLDPSLITDRSLKIIGSIDSLGTFMLASNMIDQGTVPVKKLITNSLPIHDYKKAFLSLGCNIEGQARANAATELKVILTPH